jgi:hypothetical protein
MRHCRLDLSSGHLRLCQDHLSLIVRLTKSSTYFCFISIVILHAFFLEPIGSAAFADCPCIDPHRNASDLQLFDAGQNCLRLLTGDCVQLSYGKECGMHDRNRPVCNVSTAPTWCASHWCYVDPTNCLRPHRSSNDFSKTGEYYSYETCGYLDDYSENPLLRNLKNASLRVTFPGDSGSGYTIAILPSGEGVGSFPVFIARAFAEYGVRTTTISLTNVSRAKFPQSSFTACVHDIALNNTDVCIGNFWPTPARLMLGVPFTGEVYPDLFYLVTQRGAHESPSILEMLARPFAPFDDQVWLLIIGTSLLVGLALFIVEAEHNDDDFPDKRWFHGLLDALYLCMTSYLGGGSIFAIKTMYGRIINTGYGFFLLIVGASYTANLATFLISSASAQGTITSLDDGVARRLKFCCLQSVQEMVSGYYPQLKNGDNLFGYPNAKSILAGMDDGKCDVGVLTADEFAAAQSGKYTPSVPTQHCDKVQVGTPLFSISNSVPVREVFHASISWAFLTAGNKGWYLEAAEAARAELLPLGQCPLDEAKPSTVLKAADMGGTIAWTALIVFLGLVMFGASKLGRVAKGAQPEPLPSLPVASTGDSDKIAETLAEIYRIVKDFDVDRHAAAEERRPMPRIASDLLKSDVKGSLTTDVDLSDSTYHRETIGGEHGSLDSSGACHDVARAPEYPRYKSDDVRDRAEPVAGTFPSASGVRKMVIPPIMHSEGTSTSVLIELVSLPAAASGPNGKGVCQLRLRPNDGAPGREVKAVLGQAFD